MKVNVTAKHIRNGKPIRPRECPVALAVRDATGIDDVDVSTQRIRIGDKKLSVPKNAKAWIGDFDYASIFREFPLPEPFSFDLDFNKKPFWKFWG